MCVICVRRVVRTGSRLRGSVRRFFLCRVARVLLHFTSDVSLSGSFLTRATQGVYTDCNGSRRGRATRGAVGVVGVCEGCGFAVGADFFCCCCWFFLLTPCNLRVTSAARVSGEDPADIAQVLHQTKRQ
jgi:hypothetical protein